MSRTYNLTGLKTFTVGLIILAATGFVTLLNLGEPTDAIFVGIDAMAVILMAIGSSAVKKHAEAFKMSFAVLAIDGILTLAIIVLIAMHASNSEILSYVDFAVTAVTKILDVLGVIFAIAGCRKLMRQTENESEGRKCTRAIALYIVAMILALCAFAGVVIAASGMHMIITLGMIGIAVFAGIANFLAALRVNRSVIMVEKATNA